MKWIEIEQDNLRTGTAIGSCTSHVHWLRFLVLSVKEWEPWYMQMHIFLQALRTFLHRLVLVVYVLKKHALQVIDMTKSQFTMVGF